jgi:hypothetical protein
LGPEIRQHCLPDVIAVILPRSVRQAMVPKHDVTSLTVTFNGLRIGDNPLQLRLIRLSVGDSLEPG